MPALIQRTQIVIGGAVKLWVPGHLGRPPKSPCGIGRYPIGWQGNAHMGVLVYSRGAALVQGCNATRKPMVGLFAKLNAIRVHLILRILKAHTGVATKLEAEHLANLHCPLNALSHYPSGCPLHVLHKVLTAAKRNVAFKKACSVTKNTLTGVFAKRLATAMMKTALGVVRNWGPGHQNLGANHPFFASV